MISGNHNRSPQYAAMGPGAYRQQHPFAAQQQQYQPQLLFMAGGSVSGFSQMSASRRFSMMSNGGQTRPTVVQCNIQQGFGGGGYGYPANSAPIFPSHYHQQSHHPPPKPQPQVIHPQPPQQYIQQRYTTPPLAASTGPTSGFINGIKNMVKGFIQPLNCDFYSDHHKTYNPKYRNNYKREMGTDMMSFLPQQPDPHVQAVMIDMEMNMASPSGGRKSATNVPKPATVPHSSPPPKMTDVVAIFTSEDFPELPAPRRSRSNTPAKTENSLTEQQPPQEQVMVQKENKLPTPAPLLSAIETESASAPTVVPKGTFFEIKCTTRPCGRRPTFGGRLKVVPPPFSLNKSPRTCRRKSATTTTHEDCDNEEESFEMFPSERPDNCLFSSPFGVCRPPRQRQISECSDDSFVVFFTEDADGLVALDDDDDDDDDDDEDDDGLDTDEDEETSSEEEEDSDTESEDDDDNGTDVVDSSYLGRHKTDRNKCAGATTTTTTPTTTTTTLLHPELVENVQFDSGFDEKKAVSFNLHPEVHVMHAWNYAYRAARKGHWEDFARDRTRFQKRIERTSVYLNPILTSEHREMIYRSRFSNNAENEPQNQQQQ